MLIVMLTPYGPRWIGGISKFVTGLADELRADGIDCRVIARTGGTAGVDELRGPKLFYSARAFITLLRLHPDIVHAHGHWYTLLPGIIYKLVNRGSVVVFTVHTPVDAANEARLWALRLLLNRSDIVTAVSESALIMLGGPLRDRVRRVAVPPGVTMRLPDYKKARIELSIRPDQFVVTCLGGLVRPEKAAGVQLLVRSFGRFSRRFPESRLFIVGGGRFLPRIQALISSLGLDAVATAVDSVLDPTPFLDACDAYAHVSYLEGIPLSLLEAMSLGKPVMASRVGGIPEVISRPELGLLVDNREDEILETLTELRVDPILRFRLGSAARGLIEQTYTWKSVAQTFELLYARGAVS